MSRTLQQIFTDNPITTNQGADLMYFARSPYTPGNDAGMLFSDFAAQFGTPFTSSALTKTNDTNVTLTLGGTPATALLQAVSLTLGWTGKLSETRGGTAQSSYALGDTLYSSAANTLAKLAGNITTAKQYLSQTGTGAVSAAPVWATISGSDISGAALTKTDDTNVTLTLGGTPATALLRATSLTLGWTGVLAIARGGTGVGSVTITPTATAFSGWDANSNLSANSFLDGFFTQATAAGTTTLTVASAQTQEFTGSTTQTLALPVVSTLAVGSYQLTRPILVHGATRS